MFVWAVAYVCVCMGCSICVVCGNVICVYAHLYVLYSRMLGQMLWSSIYPVLMEWVREGWVSPVDKIPN